MSPVAVIRPLMLLLIGLAVGGAGAVMFIESLPGHAGSPEEQVRKLEVELKRANNKIAALEADPKKRRRAGPRTLADGARDIAEDLRAGRQVTPDDILRASQPLMRDLAPLFDRMRVREQQRIVDTLAGELARKYDLTPAQQSALREWFSNKVEADAQRWTDLVTQEGTRLEDIMRAARDVRPDDGIEEFMAQTLSGEKLERFKSERMAQRAERVQQHADMRVQRLDSIVKLDDTQRDQIFGIMARSSHDYDPAMKLEGIAGDISGKSVRDPQQAVLDMLRPDQRQAYEEERQRRRAAAVKDMEAIGLTLPADWDPLEVDF